MLVHHPDVVLQRRAAGSDDCGAVQWPVRRTDLDPREGKTVNETCRRLCPTFQQPSLVRDLWLGLSFSPRMAPLHHLPRDWLQVSGLLLHLAVAAAAAPVERGRAAVGGRGRRRQRREAAVVAAARGGRHVAAGGRGAVVLVAGLFSSLLHFFFDGYLQYLSKWS